MSGIANEAHKIGKLANLDTHNPCLYLDFVEGRLKLNGYRQHLQGWFTLRRAFLMRVRHSGPPIYTTSLAWHMCVCVCVYVFVCVCACGYTLNSCTFWLGCGAGNRRKARPWYPNSACIQTCKWYYSLSIVLLITKAAC